MSENQRREDPRIEQIQRDVRETRAIAIETRQGLGMVNGILSERHGDFRLLQQTVTQFVERMKVHCKMEEEFYESSEKRVRNLEDWRLSEETAMRTMKRDIAIIVSLGGLMIPLASKLVGLLLKAWGIG